MAPWLIRTGRHDEHETRLPENERSYLTRSWRRRDFGQQTGQIWLFASEARPDDWAPPVAG